MNQSQQHKQQQQQQRWVIDSYQLLQSLYCRKQHLWKLWHKQRFYDDIDDDDGVVDGDNDSDGDDKDDDDGDAGDAGGDDNNATCLPMGKLGNLTKLLFLALAAVSIWRKTFEIHSPPQIHSPTPLIWSNFNLQYFGCQDIPIDNIKWLMNYFKQVVNILTWQLSTRDRNSNEKYKSNNSNYWKFHFQWPTKSK